MTLEEFLKHSWIEDSPAWEYVDGRGIQKPMGGGKHRTLQKRLVAAIDQASEHDEAFPELRCTFGGRSVVPDAVVIANDQIPVDDDGDIAGSEMTCFLLVYMNSFRLRLDKLLQLQRRKEGFGRATRAQNPLFVVNFAKWCELMNAGCASVSLIKLEN